MTNKELMEYPSLPSDPALDFEASKIFFGRGKSGPDLDPLLGGSSKFGLMDHSISPVHIWTGPSGSGPDLWTGP